MGVHTWFHRPIKDGEIIANFDKTIDEETGKEMISVIKYNDLFRLNVIPENYEDIVLRSYEKTMQFIEEIGIHSVNASDWEEKIKRFWEQYPDGTIEFI